MNFGLDDIALNTIKTRKCEGGLWIQALQELIIKKGKD